MRRWWHRIVRVLGQDRIRLPKRQLEPHDIRPGDQLQIGHERWRVCGGRQSSGQWAGIFALTAEEASVPSALLFAPGASDGPRTWLLIKGRDRIEVPVEMIVVFS